MKENFEEALRLVLRFEGKLSNHKADRGGLTNYGITQAVFDSSLSSKNLPRRSVATITTDEVRDIYRSGYWLAARCDDMPYPVDVVLFDSAVNCGVSQAAKWLQRAVGASVDGKIGPVTLGKVAESDPYQTAAKIIDARSDFYEYLAERDAGQGVFLAGWNNRLNILREAIA